MQDCSIADQRLPQTQIGIVKSPVIDESLEDQVRPGRFVDYFGARLFVPAGHFDEANMLGGGKPEPHVLATFDRVVNPGDIVIDVGANIGTHTFALASLVGHEGRVYAVEADIDNAASLRASVLASSKTNVDILAVAAADRSGMLRAMTTVATNSMFSTAANTSAAKAAVTVRLDDVIADDIRFMKLDIEGAELLALRGLAATIARSRPVVLSEFSPAYISAALGSDLSAEFFDFFATRDYACLYLDPWGRLSPVETCAALIQVRQSALDRFGWNHIDVLFAPRGHPLAAVA